MRKLLVASVIGLSALSPASAGTAHAPAVSDPAGDAPALRSALANDPTLDIRSAWFETVRSNGEVTGFAVNVDMAAAPPPDTMLNVGWALEGTDCFGNLSLFGPASRGTYKVGDGLVSVEGPDSEAFLDYGCRSEDPVHLDLMRIRIFGRSVNAGLSIDGTVWRTLVPLAAFDEGPSATGYGEGATLEEVMVSSSEQIGLLAFVSVDMAPACGWTLPADCEQPPAARPYVIGS